MTKHNTLWLNDQAIYQPIPERVHLGRHPMSKGWRVFFVLAPLAFVIGGLVAVSL